MRTLDKVPGWVFAALAAATFIAACCGATHQFALAAICGVMAMMMWPKDNEKSIN